MANRLWHTLLLCIFLVFFTRRNFWTEASGWNFLVFSQRWPPSVCANSTRKCIPQNISYWTIHGLWPSGGKGQIYFCNKSWHFDPSEIEPIKDELELKWPNLYTGMKEMKFWKHEWEKHGTCASSLPLLHGEMKYFSASLDLHDNVSLYKTLEEADIVPDENVYLLNYVQATLERKFQKVKLICSPDMKYPAPLLTTIQICYNQSLDVIDCPGHDSKCNESTILYLPYGTDATKRHLEF